VGDGLRRILTTDNDCEGAFPASPMGAKIDATLRRGLLLYKQR
jgi:hypothetical protein